MKIVKFNIEKKTHIDIEYNREELVSALRDKIIPRLVKYFSKKLEKGEIEDASAPNRYISLILETALKAEFSIKDLRKIEPYSKKFTFLPYKSQVNSIGMGHAYTNDDCIHDTAFHLIALCKGYKDIVRNYVDRNIVLESRHDYRGDKYVGYDKANAIAEDAAELAKKCIREFLKELHEIGRVMTSAELAEVHKSEIYLSTDDSFSSTDQDTEKSAERTSDSSTSTSDTTSSQGNNASNDVQQRGLLSPTNDKDEDPENTNNSVQNEQENKPHLSSPILNFLSWIFELSEWLQDQILNSTPIQTIIAETKKVAEILDSKHIQNQIEKIFIAESSSKSEDFTEDKQNQRVTFIDSSSQDLVDTDMVLEDSSVRGLILPTVAVESTGIFNDNQFSGLLNFNGLNGFEVF